MEFELNSFGKEILGGIKSFFRALKSIWEKIQDILKSVDDGREREHRKSFKAWNIPKIKPLRNQVMHKAPSMIRARSNC